MAPFFRETSPFQADCFRVSRSLISEGWPCPPYYSYLLDLVHESAASVGTIFWADRESIRHADKHRNRRTAAPHRAIILIMNASLTDH